MQLMSRTQCTTRMLAQPVTFGAVADALSEQREPGASQ